MRESYKAMMVVGLILALGGLFTVNVLHALDQFNPITYSYYVQRTLEEVGSRNMVTGIYLDYRLFDSLLEAGTLFIVTAGMLFMGKKDEEVR